MASGFFIAQGPFFSRLAACPPTTAEPLRGLELRGVGVRYDAQSFLVVVLVLTRPSSSKGRCKTFRQTTRSSFRIGSGLDEGAKDVREAPATCRIGERLPCFKSRAAEARNMSASMAILSLLKTQSGVTGLGES